MDFWSKGLGRRSLVMELGQDKVECDGAQLLLSGTVKAPVNWAYIMYLPPEDWREFFRTALRPQCATFLLAKDHLRTLLWLMWFLVRFIPLYSFALGRAALGLAQEPPAPISAVPDLTGEAEIDEAGLETAGG